MDELDSLKLSLDEDRESYNTDYDIFTEKFKESKKPKEFSFSDVIGQAALTFGPALIGYALGEEPGAIAGLQGGTAGADKYLEGVRERLTDEEKKTLELLALEKQGLDERKKELASQEDRIESIEDLDIKKKVESKYKAGGQLPPRIALLIEKAREQGHQSLTTDERAEIVSDPEGRKEFATIYRLQTYDKFNEAKNKRGNEALEIQRKGQELGEERDTAKRSVAVSTDDPDVSYDFGKAPDGKEAQTAREYIAGYERQVTALNRLNTILNREGNILTGEEFPRLESLLGQLTFELKGPNGYNLGAALTQPEIDLLMSQIPRLYSNPNTTITASALDELLGRSFFTKLEELEEATNVRFKGQLESRGLRIPENYNPYRNVGYRPINPVDSQGSIVGTKPLSEMSAAEKAEEVRRLQQFLGDKNGSS